MDEQRWQNQPVKGGWRGGVIVIAVVAVVLAL